MNSDVKIVMTRLSRLAKAWRINSALQGLLICALATTPLIFIGAAFGFGGWLRGILLCFILFVVSAVAVIKIAFPVFRPLNYEDISLFLEARRPELENKLTSAVQFSRLPDDALSRFEPAMIDALFFDASATVRRIPFRDMLNLKRTKMLLLFAAIVFSFYGTFFAVSPGSFNRLGSFVAPPFFPKKPFYSIDWVTGNTSVLSGDPVLIKARLSGDIQAPPRIFIEREGLEPFVRVMRPEKGLTYNFKLGSVNGDLSYRVAYKNKRSHKYRITAIEPPAIQSLKIKLVYPKYSAMPPEERENSGDVTALYGTRVFLTVTSSTALRGANLVMSGVARPLAVSGCCTATGRVTVERDTAYSIHLKDRHGFANTAPPSYTIKAVPDMPPQIAIEQPASDMALPRPAVIVIKGAAKDDFGISAVTLSYKVTPRGNTGSLRVPVTPGPDAPFESPWDLSQTGALQGDTIEFSLTAADNDTINGPKRSTSASIRIAIMSVNQDYQEIEQENEHLISRLETSVKDAETTAQTFKTLSQSLSENNAGEWKKNEDVQRAMERQQSLEKELTDISSMMQDNIQHMKDNELVSFDTLEKMSQIQNLMEKISTGEMKKLLEKIQKSMENIDLSKLDTNMLEAMKDQEQILRNLENTLQRLKRIHAEQKMQAANKRIEELTDRQKEVLSKTDELKKKESKSGLKSGDRQKLDSLGREEKNISDELAEEKEKLNELRREMADSAPESLEDMEKMLREMSESNPIESLDDASRELHAEKPASAYPSEEKAYRSMLSLSRGMKKMSDTHGKRMSEAVRKMVVRTLHKTLNLSDSQEDTLDLAARLSVRPGKPSSAIDENKLAADVRFQRDIAVELISDLSSLSGMSMSVPPYLISSAVNVADELNSALDMIKEKRPGEAYARITNSYQGLNKIALGLLDANESGEGQSGEGEMEQFMKQLSQLADAQADLNSMTQQLGSSGLPLPSFMNAMQSLAVQQQVIKESLSKLMQDVQGMGEMAKRLSQLEEQMEQIQEALQQGNAGVDLQRRQSDVLRRLKDATLSLRKEVFEDKRTAETGKDYAPAAPRGLSNQSRPALPPDVLMEIDSLKKEKKIRGFENAIDNYFREITAPR